MAYSEIDQLTLDINWYFTDYYSRICVAASCGGLLPKKIVVDSESNDEFHEYILSLPEKFEVSRNFEVVSIIKGLGDQAIERYFQAFESLAKRGLFVFDRIEINNPEDRMYILVCYPIYESKLGYPPVKKKALSGIPRLNRSIITRRSDTLTKSNFKPIDLVSILNSRFYNSELE